MARLASALLTLAIVAAGCDAATDPPTGAGPLDPARVDTAAAVAALVDRSAAFGTALYAEVAAEDDGNLMLSPLSATVALTMLLNGTAGDTHDQIHEVLGYDEDLDLATIDAGYGALRERLLAADPEVEFTLANATFYDQGHPLSPAFGTSMRESFDASVTALDFVDPASVDVINDWASDNTEGRVPRVIDEIEDGTTFFLLNATYFKATWLKAFHEDETFDLPFRLGDGTSAVVPTMTGQMNARTASGDGYRALELPYGNGSYSMVVVLPEAGSLADFAARLADGLWDDATDRLDAQAGWRRVQVRLPRFSFSTGKELERNLRALGMVDAFEESRADLTPMYGRPNKYFVFFVDQDTFIGVDEYGTEAAAVTTIGGGFTSVTPDFFVDRPFVFGVRERTTGALLFLGHVADPS